MSTEQPGAIIWLTGLSGSGKSTLAAELEKYFTEHGIPHERLDGDALRQALNHDLGYAKGDRERNIAVAGYLADRLSRHGVIVIATFISPYRADRERVRSRSHRFIEVYVNAPLEVCEARDTKGLYRQARAGQIQNFTGVNDPYEPPLKPEIEIRTDQSTPLEGAQAIVAFLKKNTIIK